MDKIKFLIYVILGGISYAFISFFLITPSLRQNPEGFLTWGFGGFLFSLFYLLIKIPFTRYHCSIKFNALNGMASGLLSCSLFVAFTYYNAIVQPQRANIIVLSELKRSLYFQLGYYSIGFMLLGVVVGMVIWLCNKSS